jgi:hypothetical protein
MTDRHYARVKEGFTFSNCLVKQKNDLKVYNSKDCSESPIRISVPAFLRYHWSICSGWLSEKFQNRRRLSEQPLGSLAAT